MAWKGTSTASGARGVPPLNWSRRNVKRATLYRKLLGGEQLSLFPYKMNRFVSCVVALGEPIPFLTD